MVETASSSFNSGNPCHANLFVPDYCAREIARESQPECKIWSNTRTHSLSLSSVLTGSILRSLITPQLFVAHVTGGQGLLTGLDHKCSCECVCGWLLVQAASPGPVYLDSGAGRGCTRCTLSNRCGQVKPTITPHTQGEISCMATWSTIVMITFCKLLK